MCRYDDDFAWYVQSTDINHVLDVDKRCSDCGRAIPAGEAHVHIVGDSSGGEFDERERIHVVDIANPKAWYDTEDSFRPGMVVIPGDIDTYGAWMALGFNVGEVYDPAGDPDINIVHETQCLQCYNANYWLEKVCNQTMVLVTVQDLHDHVDEYDDATLGPHFMAMHRLSQQGWKRRNGTIARPEMVERLAHRAVDHAVKIGLHP